MERLQGTCSQDPPLMYFNNVDQGIHLVFTNDIHMMGGFTDTHITPTHVTGSNYTGYSGQLPMLVL